MSNLMEKVEFVQHSAALAVSETWRGTSRENCTQSLAGSHSVPEGGTDALPCSIRS